MPPKEKGIVGIEFGQEELRAVYVRHQGNRPEVVAASHMRLPLDAVVDGVLADPSVVAVTLRMLLDGMNIPSRVGAVLGVPSEGIAVRTLTVPAIADEELPAIVQGEVEHYRILRSKGSHSFVALNPPSKSSTPGPRSVLIAAAEERVTQPLGDLALQANLRLLALEPVEFGLLRSVASALPQEEPTFVILIGQNSSDIAAFTKGSLWSYRRLEYGVNQLITKKAVDVAPPDPFGDGMILQAPKAEDPHKYASLTFDSLCTDIGYSIDYLGREYREHAQFTKIYAAVDSADLADIGPSLTERLGIPVEVVSPCGGAIMSPAVATTIEGPEGMRYHAAYGLAAREIVTFSGAMPKIDLFAIDRQHAQTKLTQRNILGSLITSVAAILIGVIGFLLYKGQISTVQGQVTAAKEHAAQLQTEAQVTTEKHQLRERQARLLSDEGVPVVPLMDEVATAIEPGVGITSFSVGADKNVNLTCDAVSQTDMLKTEKSVKRITLLDGATVQSFTGNSRDSSSLTFTMVAKTVPLSAIAVMPPGSSAPTNIASSLSSTPSADPATSSDGASTAKPGATR